MKSTTRKKSKRQTTIARKNPKKTAKRIRRKTTKSNRAKKRSKRVIKSRPSNIFQSFYLVSLSKVER